MLIVTLSLLFIVASLHGMQIDFERFEQLSGFDWYNSTLRVRKFNRTMLTLNGTLQILKPLDTSILVVTDLFHSSRGNQQFNHYPVKFPTEDVCKWMDRFYSDYSQYTNDMYNLPEKGVCPIAPCIVDVINKPFPTKAVPPFFPPGLWKGYIINMVDGVEVSRFEAIVKASPDF